MLTIVAVEVGNYLGRGEEYVRNLHQGLRRHLRQPHRFVIFTSAATAPGGRRYHDGSTHDLMPLPHEGLEGWFNKLALFKPGVFREGERVLYLDLDTIITGSLDDIAAYDGEFAMLEDVVFPSQLGSGVMAWRGGFGAQIFQSYLDAGCPAHDAAGDQAWIAGKVARIDRLQDRYPGQIDSYKMSGGVLNPHARMIVFHGLPRPHEIVHGWVPALWSGLTQKGASRA